MRGHMAISLFALVFGALETGGAVQELVYRGFLNSETEPMIIGALGTVTGAVLLWAGAALLIRSRQASVLVPAAAYLSVPTFLISGVYKHYAGDDGDAAAWRNIAGHFLPGRPRPNERPETEWYRPSSCRRQQNAPAVIWHFSHNRISPSPSGRPDTAVRR